MLTTVTSLLGKLPSWFSEVLVAAAAILADRTVLSVGPLRFVAWGVVFLAALYVLLRWLGNRKLTLAQLGIAQSTPAAPAAPAPAASKQP